MKNAKFVFNFTELWEFLNGYMLLKVSNEGSLRFAFYSSTFSLFG